MTKPNVWLYADHEVVIREMGKQLVQLEARIRKLEGK